MEQQSAGNYEKSIALATHCIGLDYEKPYKRGGKSYYRPYRNGYDAGGADIEIWENLVAVGYAYKNKMYHLTPAGLKWLGDILGVKIHNTR